jgi:hypothetical protein
MKEQGAEGRGRRAKGIGQSAESKEKQKLGGLRFAVLG